MKNISHKVVYLTLEGARCLFGQEAAPKIAGLPVVTTDPTLSGNCVVYGDTYAYPNGQRIGGIVSEDAFIEESFADSDKTNQALLEHEEMLRERFKCEPEYGDLGRIMEMPICERIPTLEERVQARNFFAEVVEKSPLSMEDVRSIYDKHFERK